MCVWLYMDVGDSADQVTASPPRPGPLVLTPCRSSSATVEPTEVVVVRMTHIRILLKARTQVKSDVEHGQECW